MFQFTFLYIFKQLLLQFQSISNILNHFLCATFFYHSIKTHETQFLICLICNLHHNQCIHHDDAHATQNYYDEKDAQKVTKNNYKIVIRRKGNLVKSL